MSPTMRIAFIIDPIQLLDPGHDTSVALMEAAQGLGHQIWITQISQLNVVDSQAWAFLTPIQLAPVTLEGDRWVAQPNWYELGSPAWQPLDGMDVVWMRKDPPVTTAYLYATYLLDYVDASKTWVINAPAGLRHANEKMYALQFQDAIPKTLVSQDKATIRSFVEQCGLAVMKPLGGKAGEGILFLDPSDRNLNSMIEISTLQGQLPVMVQVYLPEARLGDKRIILLDGEPIGAINRVPTGQEFRGNMAVGGRVEATDITDRDREICQQLAPQLHKDGLVFVGIDIIGNSLTEVNVTSPTGIREIDRLSHVRLGDQTIQWIEERVKQR
jgi:glutathione synthase